LARGIFEMLSIRDLRRDDLGPVDLELAAGECVVVSGPSGAGKSLFLRAVADLDPNEGEVVLDGAARDAVPGPNWRGRVTYVAAEPAWWADAVAAHFTDLAAARPLVETLGFPAGVFEWPVARLSTGERQRLGLARALTIDPKVLLLDEPTSGLDDAARENVERLLQQRLTAGSALLLATHDADQARRFARRALHFEGGRCRETPT